MENGSPKRGLRIVMAQLDFLVGDVSVNVGRVIEAACRARDEMAADVIVFPELALTGYPPEDLLLRPGFRLFALEGLQRIRHEVQGIYIIVGHPQESPDGLCNAASILFNGEIVGRYHKQHLPNYSVFDEKRYFVPGTTPCVATIRGLSLGLTICEDIWEPGPAGQAAEAGAQLLLNINASPFHAGKRAERESVVCQRAREAGLPVIYVNLVGGQDELVFDGGSFVVDGAGRVTQRAPACEEGLFPVDVEIGSAITPRSVPFSPPDEDVAAIYKVLVLGVRDYILKNGFGGVVIGLSGGIDSALTLAIAVDAVGPDVVEALMLPSRYTSRMSLEDATSEAEALGVEYRVIPIESAFEAFLAALGGEFEGMAPDATEENIQARCRGVMLMAVSNKKRKIVLTTGNKSELAVGYATLYGDMAGGFAPIKDVPKLLVYRLARYRNGLGAVIPQRVLERPPSAELALDQKDEDSLPPYAILDPILELYVEQDRSIEEIIARGFDPAVVRQVATLVDRNEYKRRQAPPGVRITRRAFGRDRRYPITSGYLAAQMRGGP
jgi:NAD+ synthase (glutamine-hydrolysing)